VKKFLDPGKFYERELDTNEISKMLCKGGSGDEKINDCFTGGFFPLGRLCHGSAKANIVKRFASSERAMGRDPGAAPWFSSIVRPHRNGNF